MSSKRFSSINRTGASPAAINLEPINIAPTSAFDQPPVKSSPTKASISPHKKAAKSPLKS